MTTRVGWYSVLVNIILFGLNLLMAAYSGSLALRAETAHNLLDLAASLSVLGGLALSQRKSRDFPYGLYKLENMVAVFIAFGMFFTGYEIAKEALFASAAPPNVRPIMLAGVALAMAIPIGFSQYELRIGREINSPSIIADATEFRAHILSSGVVFIAIAAQLLGFPLDRVAAVLIVLWIAYMGWRTLVDGMRVLLDASLDAPTLEAIRTIITSNPEVSEIKSLMGRNSGRYRFVESEIMLRVQDLDRAHQVATQLEESIRAEIPHVERVLIHTEPMRKQILRVAVPLASRDGEIAMDFGRASYFALVKISAKDGVVLEQNILSAPKLLETKGRGLRTAEWLVLQQIDVLMTREDLTGKAPAYALKAAGVQVQTTDLHTLAEVISQNETLKGIADAGT
jgi:cation diffusion facilitator family transporter